ncbi:MAG: nucleotidyltransferase family protein [bacterium]
MSSIDTIYEPPVLADLAQRLDRFSRTEDPADLWPGLTDAARVSAARELERVTAEVLRGASGIYIDAAGTHTSYALAVAGHTTGMGPLFGRWIEDELVDAAPDVRAKFAAHVLHARRRAERIEREVLPALDALLEHGITPVVLKGFYTSRKYFEEPGLRRMADVDIMVTPEVEFTTRQALQNAGFRAHKPAVVAHKQDWIGQDVEDRVFSVELSDERSRWILELHTSLDYHFETGSIARLDLERERVESFGIAGRKVLVPSPELLLAMLACHCSQELHSSRLLRLVEIVRVIRAEVASRRLDWNGFLEMLRRTDSLRYVYPSLSLAERLAPGTVDARVLDAAKRASTWATRHTTARLTAAGGRIDERGVIRQLMWTRGFTGLLQRMRRKVQPVSERPRDVELRLRADLRRLRAGRFSISAPDERE